MTPLRYSLADERARRRPPTLVPLAAAVLCLWWGVAQAQKTQPDWVVGGVYNSTPPTPSNLQTVPFQTDASGNLKTSAVGIIVNPSANFTRPNDTTAYAVGDLVANNTTAGSVTPLSWTAARVAAGSFYIRRVRLQKSTTTTTNASFRVHFYTSTPTPSNGDNAAWLTNISGYVGSVDVTTGNVFTDGATGNGVPNTGSEINIALASGQTLYALIEARAAYSPGAQEVFTVIPEIWQN